MQGVMHRSMCGALTLPPLFSRAPQAVVKAIETNQELVILPSSLKSLIVVKAMHDLFGACAEI